MQAPEHTQRDGIGDGDGSGKFKPVERLENCLLASLGAGTGAGNYLGLDTLGLELLHGLLKRHGTQADGEKGGLLLRTVGIAAHEQNALVSQIDEVFHGFENSAFVVDANVAERVAYRADVF